MQKFRLYNLAFFSRKNLFEFLCKSKMVLIRTNVGKHIVHVCSFVLPLSSQNFHKMFHIPKVLFLESDLASQYIYIGIRGIKLYNYRSSNILHNSITDQPELVLFLSFIHLLLNILSNFNNFLLLRV